MAKELQKVRVGRVISDKMDKTVVVSIQWQQRHRLYKKSMRRITKFYAHDGENQCRVGDLVRIQETRPISLNKNWRVLEILDRREVADVKPAELDEGLLSEEADAQELEEDEADTNDLEDDEVELEKDDSDDEDEQ